MLLFMWLQLLLIAGYFIGTEGYCLPKLTVRSKIPAMYRSSKLIRAPTALFFNLPDSVASSKTRYIDDGSRLNNILNPIYLNMPSLSKQEEMELGMRFKLGNIVDKELYRMVEQHGDDFKFSMLAEKFNATENDIKLFLHNGDMAADHLTKTNFKLVLHIAKQYVNRGATVFQLVMDGLMGMYRALDKYDPEKGFRFSTYAAWWIKQACSRSVAEHSHPIRVPVHVHDMLVTMQEVREKLRERFSSREPTAYEISEKMAIPVKKIEFLMELADREFISMNTKVYTNDEDDKVVLVKEIVPEDGPSSEERVSMAEYARKVGEQLRQVLEPREMEVIGYRYGMFDSEKMTLEDVGKKFGLTRERVRQIEAQALERLRTNKKAFQDLRRVFEIKDPQVPEAVKKKRKQRQSRPKKDVEPEKVQPIGDDTIDKGEDLYETDPEIQQLLDQFSATKT